MTKRLLLVLVMALSSLATTATVVPTAANASTTSFVNRMETAITKYTNVHRRAHGRGAVRWYSCVDRYAEGWAAHLLSTRRFYHRSWRSITSGCHRSYASENIAKYRSSASADAIAKAVVRMWMHSSGHRANLLSSRARLTGVGVRRSGNYFVIVQNFTS